MRVSETGRSIAQTESMQTVTIIIENISMMLTE